MNIYHKVKLWKTFDINTWGEYYELYNVLDVTLMADAFEHFRNITDHGENVLKTLSEKWSQYIIQINTNEGFDGEESGKDLYGSWVNSIEARVFD